MYESKRIKVNDTDSATVFVELLVKGPLSLYHYRVGDRYFAEKPPQAIQELARLEKTVQRDGVPFVIVQALYKGTLTYITLDCPRLKRKIDVLPFENKNLQRLVTDYNECRNSTSVRTKRKYATVSVGVVAGVNQSRLHFLRTESRYEYLTAAPLVVGASPFAGLSVQTTIPWVTERLTLHLEAQLSHDDYKSLRTIKVTGTTYSYKESVTMVRNYLRFPLLLRYTYPKGWLRPFVQGGFRVDLAFHRRNRYLRERSYGWPSVDRPAFVMRTSEVGLVGGLGLEFRLTNRYRLHTELRGSLGNGVVPVTANVDYWSRSRSVSLLAGFSF